MTASKTALDLVKAHESAAHETGYAFTTEQQESAETALRAAKAALLTYIAQLEIGITTRGN